MAGLKDIKRRIKSVKNSKKITYAMKLVSAAKLKKAQDAVVASREYTDALGVMLGELAREGLSGVSHPLMESRPEVKKIRLLVVGGSRGLCGAYNSNVNKKVDALMKELGEKYPRASIDAVLLGKKPRDHFRRMKYAIAKVHLDLPEDANHWPVDEVCRELENNFLKGEFDQVYLISTKFRSAVSQTVTSELILPMDSDLEVDISSNEDSAASAGQTLFEPSASEVFQAIIPRILRTKVRQAGLDAKASEHGSRMVAMENATNNAGDLIQRLTLTHNRLRQGAITAELLDIIGGAEALNG